MLTPTVRGLTYPSEGLAEGCDLLVVDDDDDDNYDGHENDEGGR